MTWLKFFNYYFCQFLFFRITRTIQDNGTQSFGILKWVKPMTGWINDYVYINKKHK